SASAPPALGQRFAPELSEPDRDEKDIEEDQADEQTARRQMRKLRHERAPKSFARVHDRIDEDRAREDRKFLQRLPRIVRAAEEDHRREYKAEHQPDVLLADAAAERQADRGRQERHEQRERPEEQEVIATQRDAAAHHEP